MNKDTTKQRLIDTGLFTEKSGLFNNYLVATPASGGVDVLFYFNSLGELISVDMDFED